MTYLDHITAAGAAVSQMRGQAMLLHKQLESAREKAVTPGEFREVLSDTEGLQHDLTRLIAKVEGLGKGVA